MDPKPKPQLPLLPLEAGDLQPQLEEQEQEQLPQAAQDQPYRWQKQTSKTSSKPSPDNSTSTQVEGDQAEEDQVEEDQAGEDLKEEDCQDHSQSPQLSLSLSPRLWTYNTLETHQLISTVTEGKCDSSYENWEIISRPTEESPDSSPPSDVSP